MRSLTIVFLLFFELIIAQEVKNNLFGFATSNTFTYCNVNDSSFLNKVIDLHPRLLRFPGGAVGNFYHFGKSGYGFDFNEIDKHHSGKVPKRTRGLERSRIKKNHNHDYIDDFIKLAVATKSKAILVANLFVDNNDILLMIEKLLLNDIEIVGVELGSELSNRSYFTKGYTIEDYIDSAEKCSNKIKSNYPLLKTAVVAAPIGTRNGHRHNIWNKKLSKLNFYDAIIIHSYAKVINGEDKAGQMISEELEGRNLAESFEIYKNRAINFLTDLYPREVKDYIAIYNKPIWVTEWNLQMSKTTGNTLLQSLFVTSYLLEILSNKDLQNIHLTTYHNLGGRAVSIFVNNKDNKEIQSTYYAMFMISKLFQNKITKVDRVMIGKNFLYNCFDYKGDQLLTYFINWDSREIICYENTLDKNLPSEKYYISSENLFDKPNRDGQYKLDYNKQVFFNE